MGVGMVTVVMAGAESSSDFSSSIFGTAGTSDDRSFRIFLQGRSETTENVSEKIQYVSSMHIQ